MKKTSIYSISLFIGLVIGILLYSLVRMYFPKGEDTTTDYVLYEETNLNLSYFDIQYSEDINDDMDYNSFIKNVMLYLNTSKVVYTKYYTSSEDDEMSIPTEYNFNKSVLDDAVSKLYGPDYTYEYKDFKFLDYNGINTCIYNSSEEIYYCSVILTDDYTDNFYELYPAFSDVDELGNVVTKYYIYYLKYSCNDSDKYCLYSDPQYKYLITDDFNKNEIGSYLYKLSSFVATFSKASDNKYYLKSLKW